MEIYKFDYNPIDDLVSNTYVLADSDLNCIIIDPGKGNDKLIDFINRHNLKPLAILLTHGHIDHIRGVDRLAKTFQIKTYIHYLDEEMIADSELNLSIQLGEPLKVESDIITVSDNEELNLFKEKIIVIHTPFHTKGSVCYYLPEEKVLFTGDTIFKQSIGRDDLPNNDKHQRVESLNKIKKLPSDITIYPGHGPNTTLESELLNNHFLIY